MFLPAVCQSAQILAFSKVSRSINGHHTTDAPRNMASPSLNSSSNCSPVLCAGHALWPELSNQPPRWSPQVQFADSGFFRINFLIIANFKVFGCPHVCCSHADSLSTPFSDLNANTIFDIKLVSRCTMMLLFVVSLLSAVLIFLSTLPFPLWSRMGQIMCWIPPRFKIL